MKYSDNACSLFASGYNCAQATVAAFADALSIDKSNLLKLSAGFGAGTSGLREQCGAVSAMIIVAGLAFGQYDANDNDKKKEMYNTVKSMIAKFRDRYETTTCKELLAKVAIIAKSDPSPRTQEYYKARPCIKFVETASQIICETFPDKFN